MKKINALGWRKKHCYTGTLLPNASSRMEKDLIVFEKSATG